jgi:hypothetical protein
MGFTRPKFLSDHADMKTNKLRPRTGIKAGDIYMQQPRGSNNGSNGGG